MYHPTRHLSIFIVAGLAASISSVAHSAPPDLCAEPVLTLDGDVYEDSTGLTISRWCEPHMDPPAWGGPVCCSITDTADCEAPSGSGRCKSGMQFWCEYGEKVGNDVVCYEPGPSACGLGFCGEYDNPGPNVWVDTIWICCIDLITDAICHFAGETFNGEPPDVDCSGFLALCDWGQTNLDGTVACFG